MKNFILKFSLCIKKYKKREIFFRKANIQEQLSIKFRKDIFLYYESRKLYSSLFYCR